MSSRCHARHQIIYSTDRKVAYIQALLRVGFDSIDFGSFVSPKAIPQMVDTAAVLDQLIYHKLQVSFGDYTNTRGAELASNIRIVFRIPIFDF
jgi:hydroxymethylglutaryl-CoA lyase